MKPANKPARYHPFTSTPNVAPATEHPAGLVTTRLCDPASQPRRALIPCLFAVLALLGFAPPEAAAQTVQQVYPDSSLIPDATPAFTAGQSFRLLFLTSGSSDATVTNLKAYNDYVIAQANTDTTNTITSFGNQFRALISVLTQESNSARTNTRTRATDTDAPIYWLNGAKVADDYDDFYDDSWDSLQARDQNGNLVSVTSSLRVWTGSTAMGTAITDGGLRSAGQARVQVGRLDGMGGPINAGDGEHRPEGNSLRFYALSPVISIIARPNPTLSALSLSGNPPMFPAFDSATTVYAYSVPNETERVTITPTFDNLTATLAVGTATAVAITSGAPSAPIPLSVGDTIVRIVLTATVGNGDVFTRTYSLTINRLPPPPPPPDEGILLVDSPLVPRGMLVGAKIRLLFIGHPSTPVPTDYSHYNNTVIGSAAGGHPDLRPFSDQFRALISTHQVDARDNTATRPGGPDVPIYWVGGDKVADSYGDFYDGSWDSQVPRDRRGVPFDSTQEILTGSLSSGVGLPLNRIGDDANGVRIGILAQGEGEEIDARTGNATDSRRLYALSPVLTLVVGGPQPPMVLTPIPDQPATVRVPFEYTIPANTFADLNNDELTYSVSGPDWLSFDAATRRVSGTPPSSAFDPANVPTPITITVTASDGNPASADGSDSFTLNLNAGAPQPPANVRVTTGDGSIRVEWDPVIDNGGYPVQRYRVTINMPSTLTCDVDSASVSFCAFDTGVSNGVSYSDIAVAVFAGPQSDNTPFSSSTELGSDFVVVPTAASDPNAFITTWRTTTANESITIPTNSAHTYAYNVDWGDSVTDATTHNGDASHTYAIAGDYVVSITGAFPQIYFNNTSAHRAKIRNIRQWGNQVWASMQNSFYGAGNLTILGNAGSPDLSVVTNTSGMFQGAILINHLGGDWDVSNVTNMRAMFQSTLSFNADISAWVINTDTDVDMGQMFNNAQAFSADISAWNVSRVTDMNTMFKNAHAFNADISGWDVSRVTDMNSMFSGTRAFNADISGWNVSRVTNMNNMFHTAAAFNRNLGAWDVGAVTTAENMLVNVTLSRENYDALLRGWSEVTGGEGALDSSVSFHAGGSQYCDALARQQLTAAPNLWNITDGGRAANCPLLPGAFVTTWAVSAGQRLTLPTTATPPGTGNDYDYSVDWGDGSATSGHSGDAGHTYTNAGTYTVTIAGNFPYLYINGGAASTLIRSVEQWGDQRWVSMQNSFSGATNLRFSPNAGQPDLSVVNSMRSMFQGASGFNSPIGHWDVSNVFRLEHMFQNAISFNQDLSAWDVSNAGNFSRMFNGATSFDQNLGDWDVRGASSLVDMFHNVTLSRENYDSLLAGWSNIDTLKPDLNFSAGNSKYCNQDAKDILTGAPNRWTITDGGADTDGNCNLRFAVGVSIDDQTYARGGAITLFLPSATGGAAPLTYSLAPLPPGLTFVESTGLLVGRPTVVNPAGTTVTYTVTDNTGTTATLSARFSVVAFDLPAIADQSYSEHFPSPALSLPTATGGVGELSYTLTPSALPPGLIYNPATRVISGIPTTARAATIYSYSVTDSNLATLTQTFMLVVSPSLTLGAIDPQVYNENQTIVFSLPQAVGGIVPLTYTLTRSDGSPVLPSGLTFNALERTIKGSAGIGYGGAGANLDFTVTDAVGVSVTSSFTLRVVSPLTFVLASIADQFYITDEEVNMTLPTATGGDPTLSYTLTGNLPPGLTFDPDPSVLTISGMPTEERPTVSLVYRVTDNIGNSLALTFAVTAVDGLVSAIITDSIEIGTPASRNTDIANRADGPITFTFTWSEPIDEFLSSDIDVVGGEKGMFTPVVQGATYTLVVTPEDNTDDGMITVSVRENVAIGQTTSRNNIASAAMQMYDTQAPVAPTFDAIATDGTINAQEFSFGVSIAGRAEDGATVLSCINDGSGTLADCDGSGTIRFSTVGTAWSYTLTLHPGEGRQTLRAQATDAAGNPGPVASTTFEVDTVAPEAPRIDDIAGDNFVTATERDAGFPITGTVGETDLSVSLCILDALPGPCAAANLRDDDDVTVTGTSWRYDLMPDEATAMGEGDETLVATATDPAGNPSLLTEKRITVDTMPPVFTAFDTGATAGTDNRAVAINTAIDVTVYDATATDGTGVIDEGITYTLSGDDAGLFNIAARSGEVTYLNVQTSPTSGLHHRIDITATDLAGNTATLAVTISVVDAPGVIITDSVTADYANAAVTFTFTFTEAIQAGGFTLGDITVGGGTAAVTLTEASADVRYTLVVTPTAGDNDGLMTVTVATDAIRNIGGAGNPEIAASQQYDVLAPALVDDDNADGDSDDATDSAVFAFDNPISAEVYDANATDGGGMADDGLTYTLSGADALTFSLNTDSGVLTYANTPTDPVTHSVIITATDKGGNTDTITLTIVATTIPTVTTVTAPNGFYREGDSIPVTVTFSDAVTVDTTDGTPQLLLITGNIHSAGLAADYTGGSGTNELIFTYAVRDGDNIGEYHGEGANDESDRRILAAGPYLNDLAYAGTVALILNGGTIHNAVADIAADLTLPVRGAVNSLSHSSDVVLDNVPPTAPSATVATQGGRIDVGLSEALTPDSLAALESDEFVLTGTSAVVRDIITDPAYQVLILVLTDPDDPNVAIIQPGEIVTLAWTNDGDSITDPAGNVLADITSLSVTNDEEAPVVAFVAPSNVTPPQNKAGDAVHIVVTFTTSVTVAGGVPQLTLDIGGTAGSAQYVSGSPGAELTFRYTVADGHNTAALGYPDVNALSLNGGTIQSTSTFTLAADLTLPEPGVPTSLSGFFFPVVIDTIAPAVPTIDGDPIAGDNRISVPERNADDGVDIYDVDGELISSSGDGVQITGTQAADVFTVTLCVGATDAADPLCEGGLTYDATIPFGTTYALTWVYSLDAVDFTDIGAGGVTLTAIATDAAGNTAVSQGRSITVDAILPGIDGPIAGDNTINAAERDFIATSLTTTGERRQTDGVLITGTHDNAARITLCAGATDVADTNCAGGTTFQATRGTIYEASRDTIWHYALDAADITAIGEGDVTLTAIATDNIGNASVSPGGHDIFVDTIAPTANSASVNSNSTSIVVTVSEELMLTLFDPDPPTGVREFILTDTNGQPFISTSNQLVSVTAFSTVGNTLTLTTNSSIQINDTVMLGWSAQNGVIIEDDAAGNPMSDFTGLPITVIDTSLIAPTLNFDPVTGDDIINFADRTAGVTLTGTRVMDATVALCIRGSDDACTGGQVRTFFSGDTPTTWRYTLTTADYNLMGQGEVDLRILGEIKTITVDTTRPVKPTITTPISGDNIIIGNNAESVTIFGISTDRTVSITLCAGATDATDPTCAGGRPPFEDAFFIGTTTQWQYTLNTDDINALGFGPVTLTAISEDDAGNTTVSEGVVVTVIHPVVTDPRPFVVSAVANADDTAITVTFTEPVTLSNVEGDEFTIVGDDAEVVRMPSGYSSTGATLTLRLDRALTADTVKLNWRRESINNDAITDADGNILVSFSNKPILRFTDPGAVSAAANAAGTSIAVIFSEPVTLIGDLDFKFGLIGGESRSLTDASVVGDTLTLRVAPRIRPDTRLRLRYTTSSDGSITDADGNILADFTNLPVLVAVTAPTAVSAVADGTSIAVTLSEPVTLTNSVIGSGGFTLSGTGTSVRVTGISNAGITLTLTISSAIQSSERATLAYTADSGVIIADVLGHAMSDFTNLPVSTSTTVVVDVTAANGVYTAGESVPITVTFSDVVTVTGTPQLALNTGGAGNGIASYTGGSGTASLAFTYSVRSGDNISDLAYTGTGALSGGSIQSAGGINLTLPTPGDANSLSGSSNVVLDNTAPAAPTFDAVGDLEGAPTGRSNRLNAVDLTDKLQSIDGVPWGGSVEAGATVTLCLAGTGDGTGASCGTDGEGRTFRATTTVGARWLYTLTLVDLAAMGEGDETVTAFATDAAGHVSGEGSYDLIIDTVAPVFISGNSGAVAINSATTVIAYDANAIDNGVADTGVTYTLGATASPVLAYTAAQLATLTFIADELGIDSATGEITYQNVQTAEATNTIFVTATDLAGNTATQEVALSVVTGVTVEITDDVATASGVATGDVIFVTFTITFSEDVNGFDTTGVTVDGAAGFSFIAETGRTYTVVATLPTAPTNDGTLTVTVDAGVATGATTGTTNAVTSITQAYDTQAPGAPGIVPTIAGDNTINIAERDAGVEVRGTTEAEAGITLCAGATTVTDPTCADGTTFPVRMPDATSATTWSYTLTADDIRAIGNRDVILTAIAADGAGNAAVSAGVSVTVDTVAPPAPAIDAPVSGDNIFISTERVTGTKETSVVVTLCFNATDVTDINCTGGATYDTTDNGATWSYAPTPAQLPTIPQGEVTLTAIATNQIGNKAVSPGHDITVDTIVPDFTSGNSGAVSINAAITVIAYDAEATDNGADGDVADRGITYTLGGDDAAEFNFDEGRGVVTYRVVQTSVTIDPHHRIVITATDAAGNTATQPVTISVLDAPTVTITDNFAGDYADGITALTYTFTFSEPVTGFTAADIMVEPAANSVGATISASAFTEVTAGRVFTQNLLFHGGATPNDGAVTVRVPANAVIGTLTNAGNLEATATQQYDSVTPASNALPEVSFQFDSATSGATEVYNAGFTDGGGNVDEGIRYSLTDAMTGSGHAVLFTITESGSVFRAGPVATDTYNIVITGEDKAGRSANTRLNISVITVPTVDSVTGVDGFYNAGDDIFVTVTFSEAVTVTGIPVLFLETGSPASDSARDAAYIGGSGTAALTFTYRVLANDDTRALAYDDSESLVVTSIFGEAIQNAARTVDADLTLPAPGSSTSLSGSSTVVLDTTAPVFPVIGTEASPHEVTVADGTTTTGTVYDANATDRGRTADTGITYALGGANAATFEIAPDTGVLTPTATINGIATYSVTITATDEVNNVATQYLSVVVVVLPGVTITDNIAIGTPATRLTDTANSADGALTFTFAFTDEAVTGFSADDITVAGGDKGMFATIATGTTYTLTATPFSDTDSGVLTVTVMENAATGVVTGLANGRATATQDYDTMAPDAPTIKPIATDNYINDFEGGPVSIFVVLVEGGVESGASVALCLDGTDSVATCTGGTRATTPTPITTPTPTTWKYILTRDLRGEGDHSVRVVATDAAGNPSGPASLDFTVDITDPDAPTFDLIAGDDLITAAERAMGVILTGTVNEPGITQVRLCVGGTLDASFCAGGQIRVNGVTLENSIWRYKLLDADFDLIGQGETNVRGRATDAAGNEGPHGTPYPFRVDTTVPLFTSGATGVVAVGPTSATVTAYDATATDNGEGADVGITYTLSGGEDVGLFNIAPATGIVTYAAVRNVVTTGLHHRIVITATDTNGNTNTQDVTIEVRNTAAVIITDSVAGDYASIADGDLTFSFTFSEPIGAGEFTLTDISVTGGTAASMLTTITADVRYTLVVTPEAATNKGTVTVRVDANAVTGMTTNTGNSATMLSQKVDNVAPMFAGTSDSAMFIVNDPVTTEAYNADATDGDVNDAGITYSLGGINPDSFDITPDAGAVTYLTSPTSLSQHTITITATDKGGNTNSITVIVTAAFSDNADLANLLVASSLTPAGEPTTLISITPDFNAATTAYTAEVGGGVTEVTVLAPPARTLLGVVAFSGTAADGSALTAVIPTGIATDNTGIRGVSGLTEGANTITIEVTAPDSATIKTYTLTVNVASSPTFAGTIAAQTYTVGQPVSLSLPTATGGLTPLTYTLTPLPAGLTFSDDGTTRLLTGTPASVTATAASLIYTATDTAGVADTLTFMVTVNAAPTFDVSVIPLPAMAYTYIANRPFTVTLPPAGDGTAPLSYTLTPASSIPAGLSFTATATASTLAGTPTGTTTATNLTYTATDANGAAITAVFSISGGFSPATVTSVSAAAGTYSNANGDSVLITIAFTEAVSIFGPLQLTLTTGNSLGDGTANYTSGEGSAELTFTYPVRAGDNTDDLAYTGPTALSGTILNAAGNIAATLTLPAVGTANSLSASSAVVLDNTAPVFPAPGDATTSSAPLIRTVATGSTTATVVYDAAATDNGGAADDGITYALLPGGHSTLFSLDAMGVLTPAMTLTDVATYTVTITATDAFGNVATQYLRIVVADLPVVEISDTITGTANSADGALTFTISFTQDVTGFTDGITVTGGSREALLTPTPAAGDTYTSTDTFALVATPTDGINAGRLVITVPADAAFGVAGHGNVAASHTQEYDTLAPMVPIINIVATDDIINIAEQSSTITGTNEAGLASVTLCFGGTDSACTGGTERPAPPVTTTTWSYPLVAADITAIGQGTNRILRAIAADGAGNTTEGTRPIRVDTVEPIAPVISLVADDDTINAAEQTSVIRGTTETDTDSVSVCIAGTGAGADCTGTPRAATVSGTNWSYPLVAADITAMGEGAEILRAYATDTAGNTGVAGTRPITVDTTVPVFSSGDSGAVAVGATSATVTAYDADATNNGVPTENADDGVTYTLSGGANVGEFSIVAEDGIVTYNAVQNVVTTGLHHRIVITATDTAGNSATQTVTISVLDAPAVIITSSTPIGDYANAAVTFTFTFSEGIETGGVSGGFASDDITVPSGSGTKGMFSTITSDERYTLVATPGNSNDGTLIVTVREDAVVGTTTSTGNAVTMATQIYDTVAPVFSGTTTTATAAVGDPASTLVYTATATDGGAADNRITYTLGTGTNAMTFNINANTGAVTYRASPDTAGTFDVTITATDKGGNTATITVTVTVDKGAQPDFGFANATVSRMVGDAAFTALASGGPGTGAVTYASDDTAVATVTNSGEVTILAAGSTTITATKADDLNYNEATASYVLTVFMTQAVTLSDGALGYVTLPVVDTVVVGEPPATATDNPPAGIEFSLTTDLSLTTTTTPLAATVCLPTTGDSSGREPILFHYFTAAGQATDTWNEIGRDTVTRDGFVCGETTTFSPFAVGYTAIKVNQTGFVFANPTVSKMVGDAAFTVTASGGSGTGAVTYASDNTAIATVTNSGEVTILAAGRTTITATKAADVDYNEATASYVLTVFMTQAVALPDGALGYVTLPVVDTVVVGEPPATAANNPPAGIKFSLTTDLSLMTTTPPLEMAATVCLPTTDVPSGREPILFHYFTAAGQATDTWNEIGRDTATRAGFVCGETTTFSPFAVGYTAIKVNQTGFVFANPTVSKMVGDAAFTVTASGGSGTGEVTYASDNTEVASVINSGEVTVVAAGRTTITATKAADVDYNEATATYVLTVFMTTAAARLNEQILTRVSQTITAGTLAAVAGRVEFAADGTALIPAARFGGQSSVSGLLKVYSQEMQDGEMGYERLLDGASFVLPLRADEGANGNGNLASNGMTMWGSSEYHNLEGDDKNSDGIDWGGDMVSTHVGIDKPVSADKLAGIALSWNRGNFDYDDEVSGTHGDYKYRSTNFHPYFGWVPYANIRLWGMGGYGQGEIEIIEIAEDGTRTGNNADANHYSLAGGFNGRLLTTAPLPYGGISTVALKGDLSLSQVAIGKFDLDAAAAESQEVDSHRLRLLLAGDYRLTLYSGKVLTELLEVGIRCDSGDGASGCGIELGGGLRYLNPSRDLTIDGNVRTLAAHEYDEWGIDFAVRLSPSSGRGLSLSVIPKWGRTQSMAERLWSTGVDEVGDVAGGDTVLRRSVDTEIGYGVASSVLGAVGVLTPFAGLTAEDNGSNRLRLGGRFSGGGGLSLSLEGARDSTVSGATNTLLLRGEVEF